MGLFNIFSKKYRRKKKIEDFGEMKYENKFKFISKKIGKKTTILKFNVKLNMSYSGFDDASLMDRLFGPFETYLDYNNIEKNDVKYVNIAKYKIMNANNNCIGIHFNIRFIFPSRLEYESMQDKITDYIKNYLFVGIENKREYTNNMFIKKYVSYLEVYWQYMKSIFEVIDEVL